MFTKTKIALATALVLGSGVAALLATAPASAQVFFSNDPAAGDGSEAAAVPAYGGHPIREIAAASGDLGLAMPCRLARQHQVAPRAYVVTTSHRPCR